MQRGHIIANSLGGGTGLDRRNLMPLYTAINSPTMSKIEASVASRIGNDQTMYYSVTPQYSGENLVPTSVVISWGSMINGTERYGYARKRSVMVY
jgi:hypothetical protein